MQADSAMYTAKREGKNRVMYFTSEIGDEVQERLSLEHQLARRHRAARDLRCTISRSLNWRRTGWCASRRWPAGRHPTLGQIPPDKFIPIAEQSGLISTLGAYILEQACIEAIRWQGKCPTRSRSR